MNLVCYDIIVFNSYFFFCISLYKIIDGHLSICPHAVLNSFFKLFSVLFLILFLYHAYTIIWSWIYVYTIPIQKFNHLMFLNSNCKIFLPAFVVSIFLSCYNDVPISWYFDWFLKHTFQNNCTMVWCITSINITFMNLVI